MDGLLQDLRYALRTLRKSPAFLTIAVLTLALGIGANLAIFTVVNAVLLQPLPFREPERIVRVFDDLHGAGAKNVGMSVPELYDLSERSGVFEQISATFPSSAGLVRSGQGRAHRVDWHEPELLRAPRREAGPRTGVHAVRVDPGLPGRRRHQRRSLEAPIRIGSAYRRAPRSLDADGHPHTVIGVMPPDFHHPGATDDGDIEMWTASGFIGGAWPSPPRRGARALPGALARLKPGITLEQAQQRLDALTASLQQTYPNDYPKQSGWSLRLEPAQTSLTGNVRPTLVILLAAVSFVLLIVCVNVASLLIARASARMREFAIRQALGASRRQLVRQVLTESMLISLAGGAAALAVLLLAQRSLACADARGRASTRRGTCGLANGCVRACAFAHDGSVGWIDAGTPRIGDRSQSRPEGRWAHGRWTERSAKPIARSAGRAGGCAIGGVAHWRRVARPQFLGCDQSEPRSRSR